MPILNYTDLRSANGRLTVAAIYFLLTLGGITMVVPFLIMATGAMGDGFDYERRSALPRHLWSREDRFMRALCAWFPPTHRGSIRQLRSAFADLPADWQTWAQIGDDGKGSDAWAREQLRLLDDPVRRRGMASAARDYGDFMATWDLRETVLAFDMRHVAPFLRQRYGSLERFNAAWEISIDDFAQAAAPEWSGEPIDQPNYVPIMDTRYRDLLDFRKAYRAGHFTPHLTGPDAPAGYLRPACLRYIWEEFAASELARAFGGDSRSAPGVSGRASHPHPAMNRRAVQTKSASADSAHDPRMRVWSTQAGDSSPGALPFPVPPDADRSLNAAWLKFLQIGFPLRHIAIPVDNSRRAQFRRFLVRRFRTLDYMNRVLETSARTWNDVILTPTIPPMPLAKVWMDFVATDVPVEEWRIRDTLPELAFQKYALNRYGSLAGVNAAYGLNLSEIQQLPVPLREAMLITFANREPQIEWDLATANYRAVFDYLFQRGLAVRNTVILVLLSLLVTLTVNPLAGYALSRFRLRATEQVIVFCLATMAFPAAVAAIPGFLLLRDLGLLNTFAALVLPGAANGMTIFLLKGFFDSLPKELYEAATIDGARELTILTRISIPLVKPILAVSMLGAFLAAYNGWEWAIIVCQDPRMWTVSVWTYQFYQTLTSQPFTVMAAFMVNSIPVLIVFLFCQKIILRGIILPQMK